MIRVPLAACIVTVSLMVSNASAYIKEVEACAAELPEQAQLILEKLLPKLTPGADIPELMKSTVIGLVQAGEIERSSARENAMAAGECLRKLQS